MLLLSLLSSFMPCLSHMYHILQGSSPLSMLCHLPDQYNAPAQFQISFSKMTPFHWCGGLSHDLYTYSSTNMSHNPLRLNILATFVDLPHLCTPPDFWDWLMAGASPSTLSACGFILIGFHSSSSRVSLWISVLPFLLRS